MILYRANIVGVPRSRGTWIKITGKRPTLVEPGDLASLPNLKSGQTIRKKD